MKIAVKVKVRAREEKVERVSQPELNLGARIPTIDIYKVSVKEAPVAGRANLAVIKALAGYFSVSASRIQLLTGQTSKQKIFEIS